MVKFLLWCILLVLCWPLALLALLLYPVVWILLIPFRLAGFAVDGVLQLIHGLLVLPGRLLRGPRAVYAAITAGPASYAGWSALDGRPAWPADGILLVMSRRSIPGLIALWVLLCVMLRGIDRAAGAPPGHRQRHRPPRARPVRLLGPHPVVVSPRAPATQPAHPAIARRAGARSNLRQPAQRPRRPVERAGERRVPRCPRRRPDRWSSRPTIPGAVSTTCGTPAPGRPSMSLSSEPTPAGPLRCSR